MEGQQIDVDLGALTEFDRASQRHAADFDKIVQKLEQASVGRESFGLMPDSGEIFDGYEQRVQSSLESLGACADAMRDLGGLVAGCREVYEQIDTMLVAEFAQLIDELD